MFQLIGANNPTKVLEIHHPPGLDVWTQVDIEFKQIGEWRDYEIQWATGFGTPPIVVPSALNPPRSVCGLYLYTDVAVSKIEHDDEPFQIKTYHNFEPIDQIAIPEYMEKFVTSWSL